MAPSYTSCKTRVSGSTSPVSRPFQEPQSLLQTSLFLPTTCHMHKKKGHAPLPPSLLSLFPFKGGPGNWLLAAWCPPNSQPYTSQEGTQATGPRPPGVLFLAPCVAPPLPAKPARHRETAHSQRPGAKLLHPSRSPKHGQARPPEQLSCNRAVCCGRREGGSPSQ